ncbi:MAG: EAL domain-containing protein [gamma proteobacterium symbiont of Taylorina sp.]|nr:EAL domain-containing protein [gamma proteobacterium symbiont of Taylorina sp.]
MSKKISTDNNKLLNTPLLERWVDGLIVLDSNACIADINHTTQMLLGYDRSELLGQSIHSVLCGQAADYQHKKESCLFSNIKNQLPLNYIVDAWFVQKNGIYLHVDVRNVAHMSLQSTSANEEPYTIISVQDCSIRRYSEKELQRLALFAELNPSPIIELNEYALIYFSNPAMVGLIAELGFDHMGMPSVLPDNIKPLIKQCLKSGKTLENIEVESGGRWFLWNLHPVMERSLVQAYGLEITLRKESEELLFAEKERFLVTLDSIDDAVITVDKKERVLYLNPKATELTGWDSINAINQPITKVVNLLNGDSRTPTENILRRVIDEQVPHRSADSLFLAHRDGYIISVKQLISPMRNRNNEVVGAVIALHDITDAKRMEQNLNYQASHDSLTGLINRTEFENRLRQSVEHCKTDKSTHALFYIDLDNFKIINDTCGHMAGDQLLCQITKILEDKLRRGDTLARLGGDEFGGILDGCPIDRAELIARDICQRIQNYLFVWEDHQFNIGASIGLVQINEDSQHIERLMSMADSSCYAAKDLGRNRVFVYQDDDAGMMQKQGEMQWVSRINKAFLEDRFVLYFQLISPVNRKEKGLHFEILLRMLDEHNNLIAPGEFLPAAEHYDSIKTIDHWVVRNTFAWLNSHPEITQQVKLCSINLSGHSLGDEHFMHHLKEYFKTNHFPAHKICFEVTETAAIQNLSVAIHFIDTIKKLGCSFSLDDFGSGMSSFGYLKQLSIDYLKIDGLFVKDIVIDPVDAAMVKSINEVGQIMGLKTIAEYVENDDVLDAIREIGVDFAQGYAISHPKPLDEIITLSASDIYI